MLERNFYLNQMIACRDNDFVKILIGVRRSGKSTLLELFKNYLLSMNVNDSNIIQINFESYIFEELKDSKKLHEYVFSKITDDSKYYLFIDEVQEIPKWAQVINSVRVTFNIDIYVTGSNSRVFLSDYITYLAGRYITINVFPLSFEEFIYFANKGENNKANYNYFLESSFPAIVLQEKQDIKKMLIDDLYQSIFVRDILLRGKIRNEESFMKTARFMFENIGKTTSTKKIKDAINASGYEISIDAIDNYISLICKAFCLYRCLRYDIKGKEILKTNGKYYAIDFGIRSKLVPNTHIDSGRILENFVYLELIKKGYKVYIGKIGRDYEIDFVAVKDDIQLYIQVSESINSIETREREIRPFRFLRDNYPRYLVTLDEMKYLFDECKQVNLFDFIKLI